MLLQAALTPFGINRSREWLREEMRYLAEVGAVTLTEVGSITVARLTAKGLDHVERRVCIVGVKRRAP